MKTVPRVSAPSGIAAPAATTEECHAALAEGRAPVATLSRTHLWPPDHALVDVGLTVDSTPECAGLIGLEVAVWGDEPDDAPTGDGVTIGDAQFDVPDLYLRAERVGGGDGRVYLIITRASTAGAEGVHCRTVVVPQSGSSASMVTVNQQAAAARATCEATGTAPPSFLLLKQAELSPSNTAPIVSAGPDAGVAFPGSLTLDATASDDGLPNGTLALEWTQTSGAGQAHFSDPRAEDPVVTFSAPGSYTLRLTAGDGVLESHDDVVIVVGTANEAPEVDAGNDQSLVFPANVAALQGTATDDGQPNPALTVSWSAVSVPTGGSVVFSAPASLATTATLSMAGDYVLRLTAGDGQLASDDDVTVTLHPEAPPILSVGDRSLLEGNDGRGGGELYATLSKSWPRPVTVDYMTTDGSATAHCDYSFRYGTLTIDAGQTEASVLLPVMGELAPEAAETVVVQLGNVTEATLAAGQAVLTILDDDAPNEPPAAHTNRSPAPDATNVPWPPTLSWHSSDPDAGDAVLHDVQLGLAPTLDGQGWVKLCPATPGPGPSSVFGYDDAADRLVVVQQETDGAIGSRVWILDNASGAGGPPGWASFDTQDPPLLRSARAAYDTANDALIVVGGCEGACGGLVQTWILHNASGNGTPTWQKLSAGAPPEDVTRFALAHSPATNRVFLFGGIDANGARRSDLWVLEGANGAGSATWKHLAPEGAGPRGRDAASLVVDARRSRLLLFGGSVSDAAASNELWAVNGLDSSNPTWQLAPSTPGPAPTPRFDHAAAFDAGSGRMLVYGGSTPGIAEDANFVFGDAWLLDGLTWSRIAVPSSAPAGRFGATVAFSPSANRVIVAAGVNNKLVANPADLWVLTDAMGSLPPVTLGQASSTHVLPEDLDPGATYLWRIVSRDPHGAWRGSPTWSFTANAAPLVGAGADRLVELPPGTLTLAGAVTDDGLPASGALTMGWSVVTGPAPVSFADGHTPAATATFSAEGTYVLRLAASDGALAAHDDLTVVVEPKNAPPSVDAGVDQTVALPQAVVSLAGTVEDDGRPAGSALAVLWSRVSGPSPVTFAPPTQAMTSVTLGLAGTYVLRLTATDGRADPVSDDVTVTVNPANGPPLVDAGPDQAITLPADTAVLTGTVVDDGLPSGTLTHAWAQLSGPASVVFGDPAAPVTTATFTQLGAYRLRLSVSDGQLSADDEMKVVVGSGTVLSDLVIERVDTGGLVVDPSTLAITGTVVAEVGNPGPGAAAGAFEVTFFEDWNRSGAFELADDLLLGTAPAGALGPGETFTAAATVAGTASFSGNPLYAFADSGGAIVESNEGNNYTSSAPVCAFTTPVRPANPTVEWAWPGSAQVPLSNKPWGSPLVIDLDLDGSPEIVFLTNKGNGFVDYASEGSLRAVNGATHADVFTTSGADQWLNSMGQIAAGNIDADPYPEIIAMAMSEDHLLAFEHDGTLKWRSAPVERTAWGAVALADLDGDGVTELVLGRQVLNTDGTLRWTGTGGSGSNQGLGPNATVVDLDLDGHPEVVAGNAAYRGSGPQQGTIVWHTTSAPAGAVGDGYTAAANFDGDANPEIVLVSAGRLWMLEHDGAVKWGPVAIPGGTTLGGSPVIGNLDQDPGLEFVVGGRQSVTAFEGGGTVAWSAPSTQSNQSAAAALFDFDGDGTAEVAYNDEKSLRIFGHGQLLHELPTYAAPGRGSVVIADADGDGKPEIVLADNGVWSVLPGSAALRVYGDSADTWTQSRPLWNQFEYHVSNVNDDGSIPAIETPSLASSRQNTFASVAGGAVTAGCAYAKPDLTASFLRVARDAASVQLTVRIGNGGAAVAGLAVPVTFYAGDPAAGSSPLGTVHTGALLPPGAFQDVVLTLPAAATTSRSIWIAADDDGSRHGMTTESDEDNNVYDSGQALTGATSGVDLVVIEVDAAGILTDPATRAVSGTVRATIRNQGDLPAAGAFVVTFFEDTDADGVYDPGVDVLLGAAAHASGLGAREDAATTAPVSGVVRFGGNVVHAMVDSAGAVAETDETNNVGWSGAACRVVPPAGIGTPVIERRWTTSPTEPASNNVAATPLVADLDGDGVADIVFMTFTGGAATTAGRLRALSGRDGHEMFTVANPAYGLSGWANLALGDIDGDSKPEIVAVHEQGRLIAFEHDGAFKWLSAPLLSIEVGGPAIADLDGVGLPEIVLGRQVLRADGSLLWTAALGYRGGNAVGTFATVADLDLDGAPEVIVGPAVYSRTGVHLWTAPSVPDGNTAVANFDSDPFPEIVLVGGGRVWLIEHTGAVRWGPVTVPGAGLGSAPVVADFDGDGRPEIGVGNRRTYTVIETAGIIRWSVATTQPASTWNIGVNASAFDFDGDGAAELVFSDESGLKVLRGSDGALLAEVPVPSCELGRAYPVVADVDGDGNAEIVAVANRTCSPNASVGVAVIGEAHDRWVTARPLWNQYDYRVIDVGDDAGVPPGTVPSWSGANTFRTQSFGNGSPFRAPDLTASFVRRAEDGSDLVFTVRIGNAGGAPAGPAVPVSLYNGDPRLGWPRVSTVLTTLLLAPGEFEDVVFRVASATAADDRLFVGVDRRDGTASTVSECREDDNLLGTDFYLNREPLANAGPDSAITSPQQIAVLSGTGSDDGLPLGSTLVFGWDYIAGPTEAPPPIADPSALTTTVTVSVPGQYVFRLIASDSARSFQDLVVVTLHPANQAPVVNAGGDRILAHPTNSTLLTGTAFDDGLPAGGVLTHQWAVVGLPPGTVAFGTPTALSTTAHFVATGTYLLSLTASDGGLTTTDELQVIVDPANAAPTANAGPDQVLALRVGQMSGASTDDGLPRDGALQFTWSLVQGAGTVLWADAHDLDTAVEFSADGLYLLRLTATDGALFAHDDVVIRVNPVNLPPLVDAGPDQALTTAGTVMAATVADDGLPVGGSVTVTWSKASGPGQVAFADAALPTTAVSFSTDGDYVLTFAATDSVLTASDTVAISVTAGNHAPFVNAGFDQSLATGAFATSVAGEIVDDGIPGEPIAATWSLVSGPGAASFGSPHAASSTVAFDGPGMYVLRLIASDGLLAGRDDMTVQVAAAAPSGPPPTASISSPAPGLSLGQPTMIRGSVGSSTLAGWRLEHRLAGDPSWTRFGFGTTTVADADLASFDPSLLLNGLYHVRLVATDAAGRSAQATTQIVVKDNFKVGHFTVSFVDLEVPVAGIPIQVGRTYDSRDKRAGDFGRGWRLDVSNVRVEETGTAGLGWVGTTSFGQFPTYCLQTPPKVVAVTLPNGLVFEYDAVVTPACRTFVPPEEVTVTYRPRPGTQGTLVPLNGNVAVVIGGWPEAGDSAQMQLFGLADFTLFDPDAYELTLPDGRAFVVSQTDGLRRITDLNGNVLTVGRNGVTHSSGRGVAFVRNAAGAITSVVDPEGRPTVYAYRPSGDLDAVTDREGHATRFRYHPVIAHHLESIEDPLGRTPLRNEYDEDGRLRRHIDAFGKVIEYTHALGVRQEIVKDRNNKQRVLEYDERGNVVREVDPTGKAVVRTFDARNNRLTETVPHVPGTPTPPATVYVYDAADNVTKVTDAENHRTEYTYNARKQVKTTKDALDRVTENTYDPVTGNLLTSKDALNQVTSYTYDGHGNVATQTVFVDGVPHVTRYDYDSHGNLARETDALGHETAFTHDANGNRLTQTTKRGIYNCTAAGCTKTAEQTLTTTYVYDLAGRLTKTINPDGTSTRTVYDVLGRQAETYDALGHRTVFVYDEMGRLTKTTFADDTFEESTYDNEGRRLTSKDREGGVTSYEYDDVGRLTRTTYPDLTFTESTYDDAGRLVASRDARGKTTTYGYDKAGRRTSVKDPLLNETIFGYDANGNQTTVKDALGRVTTYEYDALNRRTKTIFPDLSFTTTTYDALGRRRSETDQAGKTTWFEYDKVGRLVLVRDAAGKETKYTYDELGNRIAQRDANGHVTAFEYDTMGRETARMLPDGARETREYDAAGNVHLRTDFMGRVTTYGYDAMNRLESRSYATDASQDVSFTYTPAGRRLTATDARGITTYGYDVRQRLESLIYPDGRKLAYGYDANGNRSSLVAKVGTQTITTGFTYDDAGRLDVVTDPVGREYDHAYDANGNRGALAYPNGTFTDYTYNTLNRLTLLATTRPASGQTIQSYGFTLGPAGNRKAITEADGTVRTYTYDDLYRLTGERVTIGGPLQYEKVFTYDDVGNRLTQVTTGTGAPGSPAAPASLAYTYDTRDRLLTETLDATPPTPFDYDANGNLISKSAEATYTWDFENRLIRVATGPAGSTTVTEHAYDADGNRVRTKVTPPTGPPTVTDYLVDTSGSLSHVVAETDAAGALKAYYVRADDLLAVMRPLVPAPATPTDWQTRFVHADGIGSIRRLTDEAGNITDGYTYTAFGELIAHTGTDPQPYAFAGEPYDPNSGFQYHRARWMSLSTGRFVGMDPYEGLILDPLTLHRFAYAGVDPVNKFDPTGQVVSNFLVGNLVHDKLSEDFENTGSGRITNRGGSFVFGRLPVPLGRYRPDLIDMEHKQLFEIKTVREISEGTAKLMLYLQIFNWADPDKSRRWTLGTSAVYTPTERVISLDTWGTYALVSPPMGGLILYDVTNMPSTIATLATFAIRVGGSLGAHLTGRIGIAFQLALSGAI